MVASFGGSVCPPSFCFSCTGSPYKVVTVISVVCHDLGLMFRCRQPVSLEVQRVELHSENSKDSSAVFSREDWILLVSSTDTQRFLSVQTFCCMGSSSVSDRGQMQMGLGF